MITNKQARRIFKMSQKPKNTLNKIALKADVDVKTARKYLTLKKLPEEVKIDHNWRTRKCPFEEDWDYIEGMLDINSSLEAKTIFDYLIREYPKKYFEGQLRTLQRKIKVWKATKGSSKEVYFSQIHKPGELCESDFTCMNELGITINGAAFVHLLYHFVLTYSNWETAEICYSESFESLSEGFQNAMWELGAVPKKHRTDRLTTAVYNIGDKKGTFQKRYSELLNHYNITGERTQPASPNENGDIEQRHYRLKKAIKQELMLRGSKDFKSLKEYQIFIKTLLTRLNQGRAEKLNEELRSLSLLPIRRLESCKEIPLRVGPGSTINILHNTYSVHSRLIGEKIKVKAYIQHLEIWYAQKCLEKIPRLKGDGNHKIDYRHIISWLIRKPGAFENYRYKQDMFPTTRFRIAYDWLKAKYPQSGHKKYLELLHLAAKEGETIVNNALLMIIDAGGNFDNNKIKEIVSKKLDTNDKQDVTVDTIDITSYDSFLENKEELCYA
jgi:transposase